MGMTHKSWLGFFCACLLLPSVSYADSAAPAMFNVREIIINNALIANPTASDTCGGISREGVMDALVKAFEGVNTPNHDVPVLSVADARPPSLGVARIELTPEIYTRTNEDLECVSWVTMEATSTANLVVSPVPTLRSVTIRYWKQRSMAASGQSSHSQIVRSLLQKMANEFAQQYRLDQPPTLKQ